MYCAGTANKITIACELREISDVITIKEIAKRCNVSPSTVSNILNGKSNVGDKTRQRVLECVEETGYQPNFYAQSIRSKSSRTISIITEDLTVFGTNPVVESIMAYCDDNNYRTILMNLRLYSKWKSTWFHDDEKVKSELKPILQEALSIRVNGIIYVAGHCRLIDYFPKNYPVPIVISYGQSKDNAFPSVIIDDEKGGYDTAKYMISKGHKEFGIIAGAPDNLHTISRLLGLQKALYEEGIPYNPDLVFYGDWKREAGYRGTKKLIGNGITAVFCMNDAMAAGAYDYLYETGISIGKDLSVIGYDNMELAEYLRPGLTTNGIQLSDIGKKSAEILINSIQRPDKGNRETSVHKVPCRIFERESVEDINLR